MAKPKSPPKHPQWVLNIDSNPEVEIEIGRTERAMRARRGTKDEKAHYWPGLCKMYPDYADYQARTTREIPILVLNPR